MNLFVSVFELLSQQWDGGHERRFFFNTYYMYYRSDLLILFSITCNVH